MFFNICHPIVVQVFDLLHDGTGDRNEKELPVFKAHEIAGSLAFDALQHTFNVLIRKASEIYGSDNAGLLFGCNTSLFLDNVTHSFPCYVSLLVNTIGYVQIPDGPQKGVHVPFFQLSVLQLLQPYHYNSELSISFEYSNFAFRLLCMRGQIRRNNSGAWVVDLPCRLRQPQNNTSVRGLHIATRRKGFHSLFGHFRPQRLRICRPRGFIRQDKTDHRPGTCSVHLRDVIRRGKRRTAQSLYLPPL